MGCTVYLNTLMLHSNNLNKMPTPYPIIRLRLNFMKAHPLIQRAPSKMRTVNAPQTANKPAHSYISSCLSKCSWYIHRHPEFTSPFCPAVSVRKCDYVQTYKIRLYRFSAQFTELSGFVVDACDESRGREAASSQAALPQTPLLCLKLQPLASIQPSAPLFTTTLQPPT